MLNLLTRRNTIMKFFRLPLSLLVVCVLVMSARPLTFDEKKSRYVVDSELVIAYSIVIPQGKTLIIKPGVKVIIDGYHSLTVRGLIIAEGTPDMPIIFTALDRKSGSREPPEWKGIEIVGKKASGQFRHCRFEGAYRNLAWSSSPSFDSCDFAGNSYGIAADYAFPLLMNNIISENRIGMYLQLCSETVANKNRITANEVNIYSENAFGNNPGSFSLQRLWDLMQQLF
jgi:parallel beta-helix repeat protein